MVSKKKQIKDNFIKELENNFGNIEKEVSFPWLKLPKVEALDTDEKRIYDDLAAMRGFYNFYTVGKCLRCDYVLSEQKIIIEFDEDQHFTEQRELTLKTYSKINLYFDKNEWIERCKTKHKHDNSPEHRDEQRAFFDALRDLRAPKNDYKLIRFYEKNLETDEGIAEAILKIKELTK